MPVALHNTPCMNDQPFFLLTISYRIQNQVAIFLSGKQINPVYNCWCNKIDTLFICSLILFRHRTKLGCVLQRTHYKCARVGVYHKQTCCCSACGKIINTIYSEKGYLFLFDSLFVICRYKVVGYFALLHLWHQIKLSAFQPAFHHRTVF